jgi:hypothetical protein
MQQGKQILVAEHATQPLLGSSMPRLGPLPARFRLPRADSMAFTDMKIFCSAAANIFMLHFGAKRWVLTKAVDYHSHK